DLWVQTFEAWWSNKDIAVVDADGDGHFDVLANAPRAGEDAFYRLDAATGTVEGSMGFGEWNVLRGPLLTTTTGGVRLVAALESRNHGAGAIAVIDLPSAKI